MAKEVKKPGPIRAFLKPVGKYLPSIFFPTFFFGLIFMDWNHTRKWKEEQASRRRLIAESQARYEAES